MKLFQLFPVLALLLMGSVAPASAQISQGVRVCNPTNPTWCMKPFADGSTPVGLEANFVATTQTKITVSGVSARIALPTTDPTVVLANTGAVPVYYRFGSPAVNAGIGDVYLGAGSTVALNSGGYGYVAAITSGGSSTLQITMGTGVPFFSGGATGGGGGGGGGPATIADGADVAEGATTDAAASAGGMGTLSSKLRLMTSQLGSLSGAVSGANINVICTSGCSGGGGGGGYSVLNTGAYANSTSYSNVPAGGLVTTAAPTYTTGQASPLNLTTAGALRVLDSGVVSALGSPFQAGGSIGNTSFGATQSGTWNLNNIAGSISLPTGASTSAAQTTGNGYLSTLAGTVVTPNNLNVICTSGCSGGGGSGYSVVNATTYGNTGSYSNVPAGMAITTAAPTYTTGQASPLSGTTAGALRIDGSAVTQPVSGTFWQTTQPVSGTVAATQSGTWNVTNISGTVSLPTGASTSANQSSQITQETAINTVLGTTADAAATAGGTGTQAAKLRLMTTQLGTINTTLGSPFQAGASIGNTAFGISGAIPAGSNIIGNIRVDQTTPGTTNGVVVNSSALPTGAATAANQTNASAKTQIVDGSGNVIGATSNALNVTCISGCTGGGGGGYSVLNASTYSNTSSFSNTPAGGLVATSAPTYTTGQASPLSLTTAGAARVDGSAVTQPISASALPLPSGAATAANQATVISTLGSPMQNSGGSVTANLGTLNGAATAANQSTEISSLSTIATNTTNAGAPSVAADTAGNVKIVQAAASAPINVSTATTTQLVALSSGKKIYVVAANVIAGGTGNITFVYGTGTNCGTGTTSLTGAYPLTAQNGIAMGSGLGPVLVVPASNALCVTTSAAVQMSGSVAVAQF